MRRFIFPIVASIITIGGASCSQRPPSPTDAHSKTQSIDRTADSVDRKSRVLILTPTWVEYDAHKSLLKDPTEYRTDVTLVTKGAISDVPVVLVKGGISTTNAVLTTQSVIQTENISHIIVSGVAGGLGADLSIGDVVIPARWGKFDEFRFVRDSDEPLPAETSFGEPYRFGAFDFMAPIGRFIGAAEKKPKEGDSTFWVEVDNALLERAKSLGANTKLNRCLADERCTPRQPTVSTDAEGVTGSVFVDNTRFSAFLREDMGAEIIDMETASVAWVAKVNNLPFIAVRAVSDLAGQEQTGNQYTNFAPLAADNAAMVTGELVGSIAND